MKNSPVGAAMHRLYHEGKKKPIFVANRAEAVKVLREKNDPQIMFFGSARSMFVEPDVVKKLLWNGYIYLIFKERLNFPFEPPKRELQMNVSPTL